MRRELTFHYKKNSAKHKRYNTGSKGKKANAYSEKQRAE